MSNIKQKVIVKFSGDDKEYSFNDHIQSLLLSSGKVKVRGLGIFEVRRIAEREAYNVGNGQRIKIKAHNKLVFRPTKKLKEAVQNYESR